MSRVRPIVGLGMAALLVGLSAVAFVRLTEDTEPWSEVAVADVSVSDDRSTIWVLEAQYRSSSCFEHRLHLDRDGSEWTVRLEARRTEQFCTLEGCIGSAEEVVMPTSPRITTPGCPPIHRLQLDDAVPTDTEIRFSG